MTDGGSGVTDGGSVIVAAEHVVTPDGVLAPGWLQVTDGRIAAVHHGQPPGPAMMHRPSAVPRSITIPSPCRASRR